MVSGSGGFEEKKLTSNLFSSILKPFFKLLKMKKQEKIRISSKLKKAAFGMGLFWVAILFPMGIFLHENSFTSSLIGTIVGAFVGSYLYYLIMKKSTFMMLDEIERGFKGTVIPETKFESYVEI